MVAEREADDADGDYAAWRRSRRVPRLAEWSTLSVYRACRLFRARTNRDAEVGSRRGHRAGGICQHGSCVLSPKPAVEVPQDRLPRVGTFGWVPRVQLGESKAVIIAVEGPSAAGKTTWCRRHIPDGFVAEYLQTGAEPDGTDAAAQAEYWVGVNGERWRQALELEASHGVAVCDSDPLKLHYSWCLARVGAAPAARWQHEVAEVRNAMSAGTLGFADLVLVELPDREVLQERRDGDPTRRRRSFAVHSHLGAPLAEWYRAVDSLDGDHRVIWELPSGGLPTNLPPPRPGRCDIRLLDSLLERLRAD